MDRHFIQLRDRISGGDETFSTLEKFWNHLDQYQKHIICMYVYRLRTEDDLTGFIEVYRFLQWGLSLDHVPSFIQKMAPDKLKKEAMLYTNATKMVSQLKAKRPDLF